MGKTPNSSSIQTIEQLRARYEQLNEQRIQAETRQKAAMEQLEALRKSAREQFGTDDLTELTALLEQRKADNERKRAEYQKSLDEIEVRLEQIEREFEEGTGG